LKPGHLQDGAALSEESFVIDTSIVMPAQAGIQVTPIARFGNVGDYGIPACAEMTVERSATTKTKRPRVGRAFR
jgi:hypothetical protein